MTQKENAMKVLHNLPKGTVLSKHEYRELAHKVYRETKGEEHCSNWEYIIANPQNYGVERVVEYYTTTLPGTGSLQFFSAFAGSVSSRSKWPYSFAPSLISG